MTEGGQRFREAWTKGERHRHAEVGTWRGIYRRRRPASSRQNLRNEEPKTRGSFFSEGSETEIRSEDTRPHELGNAQESEALSCSHRDLGRGTRHALHMWHQVPKMQRVRYTLCRDLTTGVSCHTGPCRAMVKQHVRHWLHLNLMKLRVHHT